MRVTPTSSRCTRSRSRATISKTGNVDTPANNSTATGSIAVTGWAMDDIEVTAVNGYTFTQDADDPAIFQPLIGEE